MNVYSKFGLNILTMKDLRQFFLPPVKFQKVQIVPSGSNTSKYGSMGRLNKYGHTATNRKLPSILF